MPETPEPILKPTDQVPNRILHEASRALRETETPGLEEPVDPMEAFVAGDDMRHDREAFTKVYGDVASSILWWMNELANPAAGMTQTKLEQVNSDPDELVAKRIAAARLLSSMTADNLGLRSTEFVVNRFLGLPKANADPAAVINILQMGKKEESTGVIISQSTQEILDRLEQVGQHGVDNGRSDGEAAGAEGVPVAEPAVHILPNNGADDLEGSSGEHEVPEAPGDSG